MENKECARCNVGIECTATEDCWCKDVHLEDAIRTHLPKVFSDCLCKDCLDLYMSKSIENNFVATS